MSLHKKPLTELEKRGLLAHNLPIETPSQLSDAFRCGVSFANEWHKPDMSPTGDDPEILMIIPAYWTGEPRIVKGWFKSSRGSFAYESYEHCNDTVLAWSYLPELPEWVK